MFIGLHHGGASRSSGFAVSSSVAGLIGVRPGVRRVNPGSLGSLGCKLVVVGFNRGSP